MNWDQFKSGPSGYDLPIDVEPGDPELLEAFDHLQKKSLKTNISSIISVAAPPASMI